jgi:hypothetical protein
VPGRLHNFKHLPSSVIEPTAADYISEMKCIRLPWDVPDLEKIAADWLRPTGLGLRPGMLCLCLGIGFKANDDLHKPLFRHTSDRRSRWRALPGTAYERVPVGVLTT